MKSLSILFLLLISKFAFSQIENNKPFNYKTPDGVIVSIEIDTTKYKTIRHGDFLYKLYNDKTDASVCINEKKINMNDTIKEFEDAKKEFEFKDLGIINGEKTITIKKNMNIKNKTYVLFMYVKFIQPNELLNFTLTIPENNFEVYREEFMDYAKSMKIIQ